jgi:hypothetical protein
MTTPIVIEQPLHLEAVTRDPFIDGSATDAPTPTDMPLRRLALALTRSTAGQSNP